MLSRMASDLASTLGVSPERAAQILDAVSALQAAGSAAEAATATLREGLVPDPTLERTHPGTRAAVAASQGSDPGRTLPATPVEDARTASGAATLPEPTVPNAPSLATLPLYAAGDAAPLDDAAASDEPALIAGRYEDLGPLGEGGLGQVRRVRDRLFDRVLALKWMRPGAFRDGVPAGLFLYEARIGARLQHPGIPPVYDHGILPDGRPWYTMKQVDGDRLDELIDALQAVRRRPDAFRARLRALLRAFAAVCSTLAYAHERGVVHRDLKPENIMVGAFGEVLVLDWGSAFRPTGQEAPGEDIRRVVGTPSYMSPEQARGTLASLAPTTDVYALGATLYQILFGRPPYSGGSVEDVLRQVRQGEGGPTFTPSPGATAQLPNALVRLCRAALSRSPADRPQSAEALRNAVQGWLDAAERLERGRREVGRADELDEDARVEERRAWATWREASALLEQLATPAAPGWQRWREAQGRFRKARLLRQRAEQSLYAALAHSEGLLEAHERLALRHAEAARAARAQERIRPAREAEARSQQHRDELPPSLRAAVCARIERDDRDPLEQAIRRHGDVLGREDLLRELLEVQRELTSPLHLHGEPGVGKSALLVDLGRALRSSGVAVRYVDLEALEDPHSIVQAIGDALETPEPLEAGQAALLTALRASDGVLLLDNIDRSHATLAELVRAGLGRPGALKVLSSGRRPVGDAVTAPVPPLGRLASVEVFLRQVRVIAPELDADGLDAGALLAVTERLGGVPLALRMGAARLGAVPLRQLQERLENPDGLILSVGSSEGGLSTAMAVSWDGLSPAARVALVQASVFPASFESAAAAAILALPGAAPPMDEVLAELVANQLLRAQGAGGEGGLRFSLPEAVRAWARLRHADAPESERVALRVRHARHFASMRGLEGAAPSGPVQRAAEVENFRAATRHGRPDDAVHCAHLACSVWVAQGPIGAAMDLLDAMLERDDLDAAHRRSLLVLAARCFRSMGKVHAAQRRLDEALALQEDGDAAGSVGDRAGRRQVIEEVLARGALAADSHDYAEARRHALHALSLAEHGQELALQAEAHANLCVLPPLAAGHDDSEAHFDAALLLARRVGDDRLVLSTLADFGRALFARSRFAEAAACFAQAEADFRKAQDSRHVAAYAMNRGVALQNLGQLDAAADAFARSVAACEQGEHHRMLASVRAAGASLATRRGDYQKALKDATAALEWQQRNRDVDNAQRTQRLLLGICIDLGQHRRAEAILGELSQPPQDQGPPSPHERVSLQVNRSLLLAFADSDFEGARAAMAVALDVARDAGLDRDAVLALTNLGDLEEMADRPDAARSAFEDALAVSAGRFTLLEGIAKAGLAVCRAREGEAQGARQLLTESSGTLDSWMAEKLRWRARSGLVALHEHDLLGALHALQEVTVESDRMGLGMRSPVRVLVAQLHRKLDERRARLLAAFAPERLATRVGVVPVAPAGVALGRILRKATAFPEAERLLKRVEAVARAAGDEGSVLHLLVERVHVARELGQYAEAEALAAEALSLARSRREPVAEVEVLTGVAIAFQEQGELGKAREALTRAQGVALPSVDGPLQARIYSTLAYISFDQHRLADSAREFRRAEQLFRDTGMPHPEMLAAGNLGEVLLRMDHLEAAREKLEQAVALARDHKSPVVEGAFASTLAEVLARSGDQAGGVALWRAADAKVEAAPLQSALSACRGAVVLALAGDLAGAQGCLERALETAETMGVTSESGLWAHIRLAREVVSDRTKRAAGLVTLEPTDPAH